MPETMFVRPNGRAYRPRPAGLRARAWENHGFRDDRSGVIVFGTLDPAAAQTFARQSAAYWFGAGDVGQPIPGWWRDAFQWGERTWIEDGRRGAPGVMFTWDPAYTETDRP